MGDLLKLLSTLIFSAFALSAFAQEDMMTRHLGLCEGRADCRINIIPQKQSDLTGTCSGKLIELYQCDVNYERIQKSAPKLKINCTDLEGKVALDQTVATDALSYNVTAITSGFTGEESLIIDPNSYTLFSNMNLIILLTKTADGTTGEMMMNIKDESQKFTDVSCR